MKLISFRRANEEHLGFLLGGVVVDPLLAGGDRALFADALTFIRAGTAGLDAARAILADAPKAACIALKDVALAAPDPLGGDVAVAAEVTSDGDVVGFTLHLPDLPDLPAGEDRTATLIRVGALLQRLAAAGWSEDLEVRTTLSPAGAEGRPGIRVRARDRLPGV